MTAANWVLRLVVKKGDWKVVWRVAHWADERADWKADRRGFH